MGDVHLTERQPAAAPRPVLALADDGDVGELAGGGAVVDVGRRHHRHVLLEVERLHQPGLAPVHVDRAGVGVAVGARRVDGADHPAGRGLDQLHRRPARRADVGEVRGPAAVGPEPAARSPAQQAGSGELVDDRPRGRPEGGQVGLDQRRLVGGGAQVGSEHVGVAGVEDRGLQRLAEQRLRVVDQIGVERVIAGHQHRQGVLRPPPGTPDLLPERRPGPGEAGHQHGVQAADVDAELERVGGGQPDQPSAAQVLLDGPALLGEVAPAVRRDLARQRRVHLRQQPGRGHRDLLGPAPRADEGERPHVLGDQVGEQVGRLGGRGAPDRSAVLAHPRGEGRLPEGQRHLPAGRGVVGDGQAVKTGQPLGGVGRLGHGRRGEHERRVGAVRRTDPAQPAQHVGDVGAEDPAVVVALVDHDVAQRPQERRPPGVGGEQ